MRICLCLASLLLFACSDPPAAVDGGAADGGADAAATGEPDYARLFPDDRIVDVDLAIAEADWDLLMAAPLEDVYIPATLTYDGIVVSQVGVRLKGNSSRNNVATSGSERYSFKIDLDEYVDDQELLGVDKLNLNNGFKDPSYLREHLGSALYRAADVPAPRTGFARLTRNGEPFGLYGVVEQVDKDFLRAHFASDEGDLYKPSVPAGDLTYRGDAITDYPNVELETNEDTTDHAAFLHLVDVLGNTPDGELEAALPEVLDVDEVLRYLAVTTAMVSLDSYSGSAHNYYLYEDPGNAGIFSIIAWDMNEAYGNFTCGMEAGDVLALSVELPICGEASSRPLVTRLLAVPAFAARYHTVLAELLAATWTTDAVTAEVARLADLVRVDVAADPTAFFTATEFETSLDTDLTRPMGTTFGLTTFVTRRSAEIAAQL
jgi:spore coat protein CotH